MGGRADRELEAEDRRHYRVSVVGGVRASSEGVRRDDHLCFSDPEGHQWRVPIGSRELQSFSDSELLQLLRRAQGRAPD